MIFRDFIASNYDDIKCVIKFNCIKRKVTWSEDVFHDTILKCLEKVVDLPNYIGYIVKAYRNNLINNDKHENRMTYVSETPETPYENTGCKYDVDAIYRILISQYGEELIQLFKMWLVGYSVREIEEMSHKTKLTYQFKKIKNTIKVLTS